MARIHGILNNASGVRPNTKIVLEAAKTTNDVVIYAPDQTITTDASGAYDFECKPSFYNVTIIQQGFPREKVGIIQVYSDSADGSLNDFLTNLKPDDLTPEIVKEVLKYKNEAEAAAAAAKESEINAKSSSDSALANKNEIEPWYNYFKTNYPTFNLDYSDFKSKYPDFISKYNETVTNAINAANSASSASTSETNAEHWADEAEKRAQQIFVSGGVFDPSLSSEYPDVTGVTRDTAYITSMPLRDSSYTFTSGDLNGETTANGDVMLYDTPSNSWSLVKSGVNGAITKALADTLYDAIGSSKKVAQQVNNLHTKREAIEWRAGLRVTDPIQLYVHEGVEYLPNNSKVPFTTGVSFGDDYFYLVSAVNVERMRSESAAQLGLIYQSEWAGGIAIPSKSKTNKYAWWQSEIGKFITPVGDAEFSTSPTWLSDKEKWIVISLDGVIEGLNLGLSTLADSENIVGTGRLTAIYSGIAREQNKESLDAKRGNFGVKGSGKESSDVGIDLTLPPAQKKNAIRNDFQHFGVSLCGVGIKSNSGWSNLFQNYRVTDCSVGWQTVESWVSGWGGSGNTSINAYYGGCTTGIDTTTQWNQTFINTVVEYCDTPIIERGNNNTYINTWLEGNTNQVKIMRGSVFINGRGLSFDLSEITTSQTSECLTLINNSGISVVRIQDKPAFRVDGKGVNAFRGKLNDETHLNFYRSAYTGSGERPAVSLNLYSGGTTQELKDESKRIAGIKMTANGDSEGVYGRVYIATGRTQNDVSDIANRWEFDWRGDMLPVATKSYNLGKDGRRVKTVFSNDIDTINGIILVDKNGTGKRWRITVNNGVLGVEGV